MAMMLGILPQNIKHFSGASKRDLTGYYKLLKREYSKLMRKGEEKVFLLVYCSGHGVTANCKQVYVLNS